MRGRVKEGRGWGAQTTARGVGPDAAGPRITACLPKQNRLPSPSSGRDGAGGPRVAGELLELAKPLNETHKFFNPTKRGLVKNGIVFANVVRPKNPFTQVLLEFLFVLY